MFYKLFGGIFFFVCVEIKDIMVYLWVFVNLDDDNVFLWIVNMSKWEIGLVMLEKLGSYVNMCGKSLYEVSFEFGLEYYFFGWGLENLCRFI